MGDNGPSGSEARSISESTRARRLFRWVRMLAPYVVALGLLTYVFFRVDVREVAAQLVHRRVWVVVPVIVSAVILLFFLDCLAIWKTVGWFACSVTYREVLNIRGASYLLAAVNYHAGQGGLVYFLHKGKNVDVWRSGGTVLLLMGAQMAGLALAAGCGVAGSAGGEIMSLAPYLVVLTGLFGAYLIAVATRPRWLVRFRLLRPAVDAGVSGNLKAILVRLPHMGCLFAVHVAALYIFDVRVPVGEGLARLSAMFFVMVLPISVQGLGTGQAVAVVLFSAFAAAGEEQVLAYSLSVWTLGVLTQVVIGLVFLRWGLSMIAPGKDRGRVAGAGCFPGGSGHGDDSGSGGTGPS